MVEIAICLAIIGIALVAIIGILPIGMNTQRSTREETVINQDVATLLPILTQGMRGADDLTNYVYAITNYWTRYNQNAGIIQTGINGYTYSNNSVATVYPNSPYAAVQLTNGASIIGLLSTPEFIGNITNYPAFPSMFNTGSEVYSNHVVAYVRSMSGLATEKPPQNNDILISDSFSYRLVIVNAPVAMDTNNFTMPFNKQLWKNQHEVRLTYYWPLLPNGHIGQEPPLTFRATVAGQLLPDDDNLYFYTPQSFSVNPN